MGDATPVWPIRLYAPGGYDYTCAKCGQQHIADKRAQHCADCTLQDLRARLAEVTEERNVQNDLRQIAEDAADDYKAQLATARRDALEEAAAITVAIEGIGHCQMPVRWREAIRALIAQEQEPTT